MRRLRSARPRLRARDRRRHRGQPRAASLPDGLALRIDWGAWERPAVFEWLGRHVAEDELRRVFNLGIGFCAIVEDPEPGELVDRLGGARVIGVLASGSGTNLQALLDEGLPIAAVASNQPDDAAALGRAAAAGIATAVFALDDYPDRPARDAAMAEWLDDESVELVVLAGYMHLLTPAFLDRFPDRIVNVHPSLLPAFPGAHAVEDQLAAGVDRERRDRAPRRRRGSTPAGCWRRSACRCWPATTRSPSHERIKVVEHRLLPKVVSRAVRALISVYDKTGLDEFARGPRRRSAGSSWRAAAPRRTSRSSAST